MISVNQKNAWIINESINVPRRSMKGILHLFSEPYTAGTRDLEKFFNPDITSMKVSVNGLPNKVYSQGVEPLYLWDKVIQHFGKYDANYHLTSYMNAAKFFTEDKFSLFIDLRSMRGQEMHGSRLKMVNTKDGVQVEINRKTLSTDSSVKSHIFIISDTQMSIMNKVLESVMFQLYNTCVLQNGSQQYSF